MLAPGRFSERTDFITGAGTDIGRGFALRAAAFGARVALAGRREKQVADGGQWLNKGVFTLPESGKRYAKV